MNEWITMRWFIAFPFAVLWALCVVGHISSIISIISRGESASLIPFIGGIAGAFAVLICPVEGIWRWFWLPPLLDLGTLAMLAVMLKRRLAIRRKERRAKAAGKSES